MYVKRNSVGCLLAVLLTGCAGSATAPDPDAAAGSGAADAALEPANLTGPFLGQPLPGTDPQIFAAGVVSTGLAERDVTLSPDGSELYFSAQVGARGHFTAILGSRLVDGHWTAPQVAPFSGQYLDIEPAISPDGSKFFFASNRPRPGSDALTADPDIWVMDRAGGGWSEPRNLGPPINTDRPEYFPSITVDGTIYFTGTDEDGAEWIYRSRATADGYGPRKRLGPEVNSGSARFNAFVAPDESYVIVPVMGREDSVGAVDYYVVFRTPDDRWSDPINLGPAINTPNSEWSASVSPDGELLFFMSSRSVIVDHRAPARMDYAAMWRLHEVAMNGNSDIWWVDASVISDLRPAGF